MKLSPRAATCRASRDAPRDTYVTQWPSALNHWCCTSLETTQCAVRLVLIAHDQNDVMQCPPVWHLTKHQHMGLYTRDFAKIIAKAAPRFYLQQTKKSAKHLANNNRLNATVAIIPNGVTIADERQTRIRRRRGRNDGYNCTESRCRRHRRRRSLRPN